MPFAFAQGQIVSFKKKLSLVFLLTMAWESLLFEKNEAGKAYESGRVCCQTSLDKF